LIVTDTNGNIKNRKEKIMKEKEIKKEEKMLLDGRVNNIGIQVSGVISTASYENWKPGFSMTVDAEGLTTEQVRELMMQAKAELKHQFNLEKNNCKAEVIAEKFNNIGFTAKNGLNHVWVTSVLSYDIVWRVPEFELTQYGSRGTIGHEMAHDYVKKLMAFQLMTPEEQKKKPIKWMNPDEVESLKDHVAILKNGSLGMHWNDLSVKEFMEEHGKLITKPKIEVTVWNTKHLYTGRADMFSFWDGKYSVVDYKCGATDNDFRQLAAYAVCEEGVEQMVKCPIGPTSNKSGFMKPKISTNIKGEFKAFIRKRMQFKKEFGI